MRSAILIALCLGVASPLHAQEEEIIIEDDDGEEEIIIEEDDDDDAGSAPPAPREELSATAGGKARTRLFVDTSFEGRGEQIIDWRNRLELWSQVRYGRRLAFYLAGRLDHFGVAERPEDGESFRLFNGSRGKWDLQPELREAYVDVYSEHFDLRLGNQVFAWGAFEALGPADYLSPQDLRFGLPLDDSDAKIPTPALQARLFFGAVDATLVWLPFFRPNRFSLFGQDFAPLTGGGPAAVALLPIRQLIPRSMEDQVQDEILALDAPDETLSPENSQVALRLQTSPGDWKLEASVFYGWDRYPRIRVHPQVLEALQLAEASGVDLSQLDDATIGALLRPVLEDLQSGERLLSARYRRLFQAAVAASRVWEDWTFKLDAAWTPGRTIYRQGLLPEPITRPALSWAAGADWSSGSAWLVGLQLLHLLVYDLKPGDRLYLLGEDGGGRRDGDIAQLLAVAGAIRGSFLRDRLRAELRGYIALTRGDGVGQLRIAWHFDDHHQAAIGGELFEGPNGSLGGSFDHNDRAYVEYAYAF